MNFSDEYEYEVNGNTYYVSVTGQHKVIDAMEVIDLDNIEIFDEAGNYIDSDDEHYCDIYEDALSRDYNLEIHGTDFDYYDIA